jgi:hypothetical protein
MFAWSFDFKIKYKLWDNKGIDLERNFGSSRVARVAVKGSELFVLGESGGQSSLFRIDPDTMLKYEAPRGDE